MITALKNDESLSVAPVRPWHRFAPCRNVTWLEWFPDDWETRPDPGVVVICDACPFAADCLQDALNFPDTDGVRGGTLPYQRRQLNVVRDRAKCPVCFSDAIIPSGRYEICVSCATSWPV
jgi:hypothetical protein